jgi:hypothetical protein
MSGIGIGLFAATAVGLLAAQGRLNTEGTRGIPLLSALFTEPKAEGKGHAQPESKPSAGPRAGHTKLVPKPEPLPFRKVGEPEPNSGEGGHGAAEKAGEHEKKEEPEAAGHQGKGEQPEKEAGEAQKPTEWQHKIEDLMGEGQYHRGRLFRFERLEGGMSVDELNETLRRAQKQLAELETREKAIEKRKTDLDARDTDIRDRQRAVDVKLLEVQNERTKLEREVEDFHRTVLLIRQDEEKNLKEIARTMSSLEPKKAADLVLQMWQSAEGQVQAGKILVVMDPDAADAIVGEFETKKIKEILEQRLKFVRLETKDKKK